MPIGLGLALSPTLIAGTVATAAPAAITRQFLLPGYGQANTTATRQYMLPGYGMINEVG